MRTSIFVRTTFVGYHRWKDAPSHREFLKSYHRHVFHVKVTIPVEHDNREKEFFDWQYRIRNFCQQQFGEKHFEFSCEQIGQQILEASTHNEISEVEVSEDGENGAIVQRYTPLYAGHLPVTKEYVDVFCAPLDLRSDATFSTGDWVKTPPISEGTVYRTKSLPGSGREFDETFMPDPPKAPIHLQKRTKCFIGTEAEGPNRGKKVLFIPGSCTPERLKCLVGKQMAYIPDRFYYGAGNDLEFRKDTLDYLMSIVLSKQIDIEIASSGVLLKYYNLRPHGVTVISRSVCDENFADWIKSFTDTEVVWTKQYRTKLNDPLFQQDTYVE